MMELPKNGIKQICHRRHRTDINGYKKKEKTARAFSIPLVFFSQATINIYKCFLIEANRFLLCEWVYSFLSLTMRV